MNIRPVSLGYRFFDYILSPFMRLISLAPFERPQESHAWHMQQLTPEEILSVKLDACVFVHGDDTTFITSEMGPLFHIPLVGGWRNYVVLEIEGNMFPWHIGWIVCDEKGEKTSIGELQRLPLYESSVRMLVGPIGKTTIFCAFDKNGVQQKLHIKGKGCIGDGSRYGSIRLF